MRRRLSGHPAVLLAALALFSAGYAPTLFAAFGREAAGTTGSDFLNLDVGARGIGMGGAFSTAVNDATAIYWNPAALTRISKFSANAMHNAYLADIQSDFASYAHRLDEEHVIAVAMHHINIGGITQTDISGSTLGEFNPKNTVYSLAVGRTIFDMTDGEREVDLGITGKFFSSQIVEKASGWGVDVGILVSYFGRIPNRLGVQVQNLGQGQKFDQKRDPLPAAFKFGGSLTPAPGILFSADVTVPQGGQIRGAVGTELSIVTPEETDLRAAIRGGIDTEAFKDQPGFSGVSMGLGFSFAHLAIDYAYVPFGELGNTQRISLSFGF